MTKFKKGDVVVATKEATEQYSTTQEGWTGVVLAVDEANRFFYARGLSPATTKGSHTLTAWHTEFRLATRFFVLKGPKYKRNLPAWW